MRSTAWGRPARRCSRCSSPVDPDRDTTDVLARYVALFHPRLIGLTGTPDEIGAVSRAYKAYYARYTPPGGADYAIDHTGFVYLMDRKESTSASSARHRRPTA